MSKDPKEPAPPPMDLFPYDEMSTGETSSLVRRAQTLTGAPDAPLPADPTLKPMTGAQLAFRPSAPPRTGTQPALKPGSKTGAQPAFVPPASKSGVQPAFVPSQPASRTGSFKPLPPREEPPAPEPAPEDEEHPVFDAEKLQRQIRAMSLTDSAHGHTRKPVSRPVPSASPSAEDTFTKKKMRQAEINMPDFDLDEDLG